VRVTGKNSKAESPCTSEREAHQVVKLYRTISAVNKRPEVQSDRIHNRAIMQMPQIYQNKSNQLTLNTHFPLKQLNQVDGSHQPQKQAHLQSNPSASSTMDYSDIKKFGEWNSEEEADDQINKTHSWQTVNNKRRRIRSQTSKDSAEKITVTNRFQSLPTEDSNKNHLENTSTNTNNDNVISHKPPPIYIYGVTNYKEMVQNLLSATEMETYNTKAMANNVKSKSKNP
jgi:predicted membrane-bound mannosyltransferase